MLCEYCSAALTGQETECPTCHRPAGWTVQAEVFRDGRGKAVCARREEEIPRILRPASAAPVRSGRNGSDTQPAAQGNGQGNRPGPGGRRGDTVSRPEPAGRPGAAPEPEIRRTDYERLSKDYDSVRKELEAANRQNEQLKKRSIVSGVLILAASVVLIAAAVALIVHTLRRPSPGPTDEDPQGMITAAPTEAQEEPTPTEAQEEPTPTEAQEETAPTETQEEPASTEAETEPSPVLTEAAEPTEAPSKEPRPAVSPALQVLRDRTAAEDKKQDGPDRRLLRPGELADSILGGKKIMPLSGSDDSI